MCFLHHHSRVFSRTAAIPFERISGVQKLEGSLALEASLQPLLNKAVLSVGTLIELREDFEKMCNDALFQEICSILEKSQLDLRSQMNYALLLFSTGKVSTGNFAKFTLSEQRETSRKIILNANSCSTS